MSLRLPKDDVHSSDPVTHPTCFDLSSRQQPRTTNYTIQQFTALNLTGHNERVLTLVRPIGQPTLTNKSISIQNVSPDDK